MKNNGFTLIELLVVIAIIGLIASVVLVTIGGGGLQSKARIGKTLEFSQSIQSVLGAYAVGVWGFDQGSGTSALDGSGFGNNGTLGNGACTPGTGSCPSWSSDTPHSAAGASATGKFSLSFDGTDDYVSVPHSSNLIPTTAVTAEAWVKPNTGYGETAPRIIEKGDGKPVRLYIGAGSGILSNSIYINGTQRVFSSNTVIPTNVWTHVAVSYNGTTHRIYINGKLDASDSTYSGTISTGTELLFIGNSDATGNRTFNGLIDEVRIYETALSLGQIQQHYAEGLERHQNLAIK